VITGQLGNWFYGRAAGVATSITGGVAALGMSMYGDLWTMTSLQEKCGKMRLYEEGFEAMETVSVMPVSLVSSLKGVSKGENTQKVYALNDA
jgi:hypothetical protein